MIVRAEIQKLETGGYALMYSTSDSSASGEKFDTFDEAVAALQSVEEADEDTIALMTDDIPLEEGDSDSTETAEEIIDGQDDERRSD